MNDAAPVPPSLFDRAWRAALFLPVLALAVWDLGARMTGGAPPGVGWWLLAGIVALVAFAASAPK